MPRRWISTSRRCLNHKKTKPRSRRNVGSQGRDVGILTPWNVATLDLNIATSVSPLSGTSRRWIQTSRRWIYTLSATSRRCISTLRRWLLHPREHHNVEPERRDVAPVLCPRPSFLSYPCPTLPEPFRTSIVAVSDHLVASTTTSLNYQRQPYGPVSSLLHTSMTLV